MIKIDSKKQGAEIISINKDGEEKLHNGIEYWQRHAPVLFPIVGQLKEGKTIIDGKEYKMGQHGFARDMDFEEIEKNDKMHKYVLKSNELTRQKYPYEFELYISYLVEENSVITKYEVVNCDTREILFGIGGHPALKCDYSKEEHEIEFTKNEDNIEFLELENGLISNTKGLNILRNNKIELLKDTFEKDAIIMKNVNSDSVILRNKITGEEMLEFSFKGFPYLAIWSKKEAPFVCIEPWFNLADSIISNGKFESKENILKLQVGEKFEAEYKIIFK